MSLSILNICGTAVKEYKKLFQKEKNRSILKEAVGKTKFKELIKSAGDGI